MLTAFHWVPLFVDRKIPVLVPAKIFEPNDESERMFVFVIPLLTGDQLIPLLEDKKTPPPVLPEVIVLACPESELHSLPLQFLHLLLRRVESR